MKSLVAILLLSLLSFAGLAWSSAADRVDVAKNEVELEVNPEATESTTHAIAEHEVVPGESLWRIAAITVGDGNLWPALYRANRDQIQNPRVLYPGQRLEIPEIAPDERAAIRAEAKQYNSP